VRWVRAVAVAAALAAGCGADQDPGVPTAPVGTATTSRPLPACPPGGPDETTPEAGCIDDDGRVLRP
jgi:hypothetical protein